MLPQRTCPCNFSEDIKRHVRCSNLPLLALTAAELPEDDGREYPATASPEEDVGKEKSVKKNDDSKPRPASEAKDATRKDEL